MASNVVSEERERYAALRKSRATHRRLAKQATGLADSCRFVQFNRRAFIRDGNRRDLAKGIDDLTGATGNCYQLPRQFRIGALSINITSSGAKLASRKPIYARCIRPTRRRTAEYSADWKLLGCGPHRRLRDDRLEPDGPRQRQRDRVIAQTVIASLVVQRTPECQRCLIL